VELPVLHPDLEVAVRRGLPLLGDLEDVDAELPEVEAPRLLIAAIAGVALDPRRRPLSRVGYLVPPGHFSRAIPEMARIFARIACRAQCASGCRCRRRAIIGVDPSARRRGARVLHVRAGPEIIEVHTRDPVLSGLSSP